MNAVEISVEGVGTPDWLDRARVFVLAALERLGKDNWDVSILVCDDAFIRGLNRQYRDRDEPTDVLSFEQGDTYRAPEGEERLLAGDIVVSLEALSRNAQDFGIAREEELRRLLVHGLLHLSGMDHVDNSPDQPMLALQEEMLLDLERSLGPEGRIL